MLESVIGIAASIFTAGASIPQLVKLIREKKADDISSIMLFVLLAGLGLWTWYGFLKSDWILLASNSFSFLINSALLSLAFIYKRKRGS